MTFKDLRKRITSSSQQQTQSFDKLQNKPFWIWVIIRDYEYNYHVEGKNWMLHTVGQKIYDLIVVDIK